jgi:hypothetical protein
MNHETTITTIAGLYHGNDVEFEGIPKEPLRLFGRLWHVGWDIPTLFAVDQDRRCWMNGAHGGNLIEVEARRLLAECQEDDTIRDQVRGALELKPGLPGWAATALKNGWVPPADFDLTKYGTE